MYENYVKLGWHLIPILPKNKIPALKDWVNNCSNNQAVIDNWFNDQYKDHNVGVVTGKNSEIFVVDIDTKPDMHGITGKESLAELIFEKDFPKTVESITGSSGMHIFFKCPPTLEISNSVSKLAHGIDIRGNGGQVLIPPSLHPNGNYYKWLNNPKDTEIAFAPMWLLNLIESKSQPDKTINQSDKIEHGSRNERLTSLAGTMRKTKMSKEAILAGLLETNRLNVNPPLPEQEIHTIVNSVCRYDNSVTVESFDKEKEIEKIELSENKKDATQVKEFIEKLSKEDPLDREVAIENLAKITGFTKSNLNKQLTSVIKKDKKQQKSENKEATKELITDIANIISSTIIIPLTDKGLPTFYLAELIIAQETGRKILTHVWNSDKTLTNPVIREIERIFKRIEITDNPEQLIINLGNAKRQLESDIEMGKSGIIVEKLSGAVVRDNEFHVKTNLKKGVLISVDNTLIEEGITPIEDNKAFDDWKEFSGDSAWHIEAAHIIAAICNIHQTEKHFLLISGSAGSGKTTKALLIQKIIDGIETVIPASSVQGSYPKLLSCRSPIIDNIDHGGLKFAEIDNLAAMSTTKTLTLEARYTRTGYTGEPGYPILTSTDISLLDRFTALKTRTIQIIQNADMGIRSLIANSGGTDQLVDRVKPHFWYLVNQYLEDIKNNAIPASPGLTRLSSFSRAFYWVLTKLSNYSSIEAEKSCAEYKDQNEQEEENLFIESLMEVLDGLTEENRQGMKSKDIAKLMNEILSNKVISRLAPKGRDELTSKGISRLIGKNLDSNKIGHYKCIQKTNNNYTTHTFIKMQTKNNDKKAEMDKFQAFLEKDK